MANPLPAACTAAQLDDAARFVKLFANPARLLVLARLADKAELHVAALNEAIGIAPPALSQHLARLREEGAICYRRDHSTLYYRLAPERESEIRAFLSSLAAHLDGFKPVRPSPSA